jgi:hypothetical protein
MFVLMDNVSRFSSSLGSRFVSKSEPESLKMHQGPRSPQMHKRPPMTAYAIGARNSPPSPNASALGIIPAIIAIVVITMGRARFWPASMMQIPPP